MLWLQPAESLSGLTCCFQMGQCGVLSPDKDMGK